MAEREPETPGEIERFEGLLRRAKSEFGDTVTEDEERLLKACVVGEVADFTTPDFWEKLKEAQDEESKAMVDEPDEWPERPEPPAKIRAEVVAWLLTSAAGKRYVHPHGVRMRGVRIEDTLRLAHATLHGALWANQSELLAGCDLIGSRFVDLHLNGSLVKAGMMSRGGIQSVHLDDSQSAGNVSIQGGFLAKGEVRLLGASIGGDLACSGGRFRNPGGNALSADGCQVGGFVFLKDDFQSVGAVRLLGASIGGSLSCIGGRFHNPGGDALNADRCLVGGHVLLNSEFQSVGAVWLLGARIGGNLECIGGRFRNPNGDALMGEGCRVSGTLFVRGIGSVEGRIVLTRSRIAYLYDGERNSAWPDKIVLTDCRYDAIYAGSPLDARSRLQWLAKHDSTAKTYINANEGVIDPQPYRWLAEVMKKQGHEEDARTVLRVCAERRVKGLVAQAFAAPIDRTYRYLIRRAAVLAVLCIALLAGGYWLGAAALAIVVSWFALQAFKHRGDDEARLRVCQLVEGNRVRVMQHTYRWVVGHGYARWRVLVWLGLVLSVGTFLLVDHPVPVPGGLMQPTQSYALKEWSQGTQPAWYEALPKYNPFLYSADALVPLVSFHQEEHWTPSTATWRGWFVKNVYLPLHIAAGWVIATLFVASFTRLMRQEG